MPIDVAAELVEYLQAEAGGSIAVRDAEPADSTERALAAARRAVCEVRHPEEPDDPFVSYATPVAPQETGLGFSFDAKDLGAYDGVAEALIDKLISGLESGGLRSGRLIPGRASWVIDGIDGGGAVEMLPVEPSYRGRGLVPTELFVVGEFRREDRRSDYDLCRIVGDAVERLTTGHFIHGIGRASGSTVVNEFADRDALKPGEEVTRLWALDGNDRVPIPGLGSPQCGSFAVSPSGHLVWTSGGHTDMENFATSLQARWADVAEPEVLATGEAGEPYRFDQGTYFWSPSVAEDGSLAFLSGNSARVEVVVRSRAGRDRRWSLPKRVQAYGVVIRPGHVAIELALKQDAARCVGILDRSSGTVAHFPNWKLATPGSTSGGFVVHRYAHQENYTELAWLEVGESLSLTVQPFAQVPMHVSHVLIGTAEDS